MKTLGEFLELMIGNLEEGIKRVDAEYENKRISIYRIGDKQIRIDIIEK